MQVHQFQEEQRDTWFIKMAVNKAPLGIMCRETEWKFGSQFLGKIDHQKKQFWMAPPKSLDIFAFQNKIKEHEDKTFVATVQWKGQIFGIHFKIVGIDREGLIGSFPTEVYEINRRQSKRFDIPNLKEAQLTLEVIIPKISMVPIQLPITDISIHGVGFKVPDRHRALFVKDQLLPVAMIKINGKNLSASLEIRNMFANNNDIMHPYKIGARFLKIDTFYQIEIQKYIAHFEKAS